MQHFFFFFGGMVNGGHVQRTTKRRNTSLAKEEMKNNLCIHTFIFMRERDKYTIILLNLGGIYDPFTN